MLSSTVGQLFANEALPDELRDYDRVLDKKEIKRVLREVALKYPERYREISHELNQLGREAAQESGSFSFGVRHMAKSKAGNKIRNRLKAKIKSILQTPDLTDKRRNELLVRAAGSEMSAQQDEILQEALAAENPLALQVLSGTRGNKMNLSSLMGSDLLYADSSDNPLPIPVLRSYSEGLSPAEYFAGSYGARKGIIATKFATQDAGFLGKQLNQVAHRLVVTDKDYADEGQRGIRRGMPVDTDDQDNEGALLAQDVGPYKRNTVITPKVRRHLNRLGHKKILVRSPLVGGSPSGGVYARDVGVRERGNLPGKGDMVGLQAAQALSEPLSQGQLSAKHSGGVAGEEKAVSGFQYINQLIQVPKVFKGGAAHSTEDGTVQRIEAAPAGGYLITINDSPHYVAKDFDLRVKKGDKIEAGDVLSEGFPNPSLVTKYKGVGEGRRYFVNAFRDAMRDAGLGGHRRNIELLSRGLINHVRLTDEYGENVPDDVIPYSTLEHRWKPREGYRKSSPKQAVGKYLEQPVLHYTIGTKVRPSMLKNFKEFGIDEVDVHDEPPPFEPEMIRGMYSLQHDPDWLTRFYGSGVKKSLLSATQRGAVSEERGTSFVPSISRSVDFGRTPNAFVRKPAKPYEVEEVSEGVKVAAGPYTVDSGSFTPAQQDYNKIFQGSKPGGNPALRRGREMRARADQMKQYHQNYGTRTDNPDGSYSYKTPHPFAGQNIAGNTLPQYLPTATYGGMGAQGPSVPGAPAGVPAPAPAPVSNDAITAPRSPNNLSGSYDPSRAVRSYSGSDFTPQQNLPGMLGNPMGMQMASQMGPMGLMAGASPQDFWTSVRARNTDARLGGLSNAFYDAYSGGVDSYASRQYGGYEDGVIRGNEGGVGGVAGPSDEFVAPAYSSPGGYQSGTTLQNTTDNLGLSTAEGQRQWTAIRQGTKINRAINSADEAATVGQRIGAGLRSASRLDKPPVVPKPPKPPSGASNFMDDAVRKAKQFANKIPGVNAATKGTKFLKNTVGKIPGVKYLVEPAIYGFDIASQMQDGKTFGEAMRGTSNDVLDDMEGWQDWLTTGDNDTWYNQAWKRPLAFAVHGLTGPVQAALAMYAAGDAGAQAIESSLDTGQQAQEMANRSGTYRGSALQSDRTAAPTLGQVVDPREIYNNVGRATEVITGELPAIAGATRAETARGQSLDAAARQNRQTALQELQAAKSQMDSLRPQQTYLGGGLGYAPGTPSQEFLDAQSKFNDLGGQRELDAVQKYLDTSDFARNRANMNTAGKVLDDMSNRSVGIPGYEDVVIPGTDTGIKGFASFSDILSGNFSLNPFYSRTDRANQQQRAANR